ncbi:sensor histidine kinase [Celerinatantimonas sp. YJH-8]|uniref:sensor histidine kinase n=1 Tax=Celerinatantimonas sp. YJH-8 TaxID=3228714 RepID=UPI0038C89A84
MPVSNHQQSFSQQQLAQVFDVLPSGLILLDQYGYIAKANPAARTLFNCELEGQRWSNIALQVFVPQADDGHELSLHNGRRIQLTLATLLDSESQLIMLTDVTATRQLQANISRLEKLSALGRMVASLAHQIRTPLSAAMLYGSNLANNHLPETARKNFQTKMMARLADLENQVNDMLLFARNGEQPLAEQVSVVTLMTQLSQAMDAKLQQKRLRIDLEYCDPDVLIMANSNSLVSALSNLIDNAIHVSHKDGLIGLYARTDGQHVQISVVDSGPGLDEQVRSQLFEPFVTTKQNGTGLGLSVVKSVVQAHKGTIAVESRAGEGCCFTVNFPVYQVCAQSQVVGG